LFIKFKKSYKTIFLDPFMEKVHLHEKVNVILSPSLYWVKKISLPVRYVREVKKLLPSLFEDILPEGHYSYYVYKQGDEYIGFAYDDRMILDMMAEKGISPANVANIYFAQSELYSLEGAYKINDKQILTIKEGIVIVVPSNWVKETKRMQLDNLKLSKHAIVLQQFHHILEKSGFYKIGFVLVLLIVIIFGEWLIIRNKATYIADQRSKIFTQYHLKSTMMQNRAIDEELHKIYDKQMKLRKYIGAFLKLHLAKGEKISYIGYDSNKLRVIIKGVTEREKIVQELKRQGIDTQATLKNSVLTLELTL